ncbi:hypothetical protein [Kitasatospora phosalacinea]|uniref:hypothetical protein n=1 Tax=Kitasatospora phosalacinea TaxID=2065 RepID=UPI0006897CFA|nr:hypothetical protein [Kitasatospora phosalacinea]
MHVIAASLSGGAAALHAAHRPGNGAQLVDTEGRRFTDTYQETAAGPSFSGTVTIAPGDTALGFVTFAVPTSSEIAKVQSALNSGLADSVGQWTVS